MGSFQALPSTAGRIRPGRCSQGQVGLCRGEFLCQRRVEAGGVGRQVVGDGELDEGGAELRE